MDNLIYTQKFIESDEFIENEDFILQKQNNIKLKAINKMLAPVRMEDPHILLNIDPVTANQDVIIVTDDNVTFTVKKKVIFYSKTVKEEVLENESKNKKKNIDTKIYIENIDSVMFGYILEYLTYFSNPFNERMPIYEKCTSKYKFNKVTPEWYKNFLEKDPDILKDLMCYAHMLDINSLAHMISCKLYILLVDGVKMYRTPQWITDITDQLNDMCEENE